MGKFIKFGNKIFNPDYIVMAGFYEFSGSDKPVIYIIMSDCNKGEEYVRYYGSEEKKLWELLCSYVM